MIKYTTKENRFNRFIKKKKNNPDWVWDTMYVNKTETQIKVC